VGLVNVQGGQRVKKSGILVCMVCLLVMVVGKVQGGLGQGVA